jgi:hypothetical protein
MKKRGRPEAASYAGWPLPPREEGKELMALGRIDCEERAGPRLSLHVAN